MTRTIEVESDGPRPTINIEEVCAIIMMARDAEAPDAGVDPDASNPIDDGFTVSLTEKGGEAGERSLKGAIAALNADGQDELVALAWVGRGDFGPDEWSDAVRLAGERREGPTAAYLLRMEMLAEHLDAGLAAFDLSCSG